MRILGIDPGLVRTGYGLIDATGPDKMNFLEGGVIKTSSKDGISNRVGEIYKNLTDIIKEYKPEVLVLEKLYRSARSFSPWGYHIAATAESPRPTAT